MMQKLMKRRRFLFVLVCALLLLLLSLGTFWVVGRVRSTKENTQTTPTRPASATANAHATATALARPLFVDYFTNNKHGWSTDDVAGFTRTVQDNMLTLTDTNHTVLVESLPTNLTFKNFSLTTTFTLTQAEENDSVGLYLRGDSNLDHDYRIDIFGNSTYAISKESLDVQNNNVSTFLIPPTTSSFLNPVGQQNTLAVTMNDIELTMQLNGHLVGSITDADYKQGQIALFVSNSANSASTTATFSSIAIYPLPEQLADMHPNHPFVIHARFMPKRTLH
jgi:hypothetical protein